MTEHGHEQGSGKAIVGYLAALRTMAEPPSVDAGAYRALAACRETSAALDTSLGRIFAGNPVPNVAVVAVGGYGRSEQSRHSDLDVMLLIGREDVAESAKNLLYPLWDARLKVGHSVRTIQQTLEASENVETLTALIDSRFVAGDVALYEKLQGHLGQHVKRRLAILHSGLQERRADLVAREPWQLQEPNIKTGRGGLRSLQAIHWLDAAAALAEGRPIPTVSSRLAEDRETLLATRNALHALDERPNDRYLRDLVSRVADWLGVDPLSWTRELLGAMRRIDAAQVRRLEQRPEPVPQSRFLGKLRWRGARKHERESADTAAPVVAVSSQTDLDLLLNTLGSSSRSMLEPLPSDEWLGRLLPEWEALRCLPHAVLFHSHPVDVHAWRTVEEAAFAMQDDQEGIGTVAAADALSDGQEVLLAALLHDMGKGHEGDHSEVGAVIAERFAARAGLDAETAWRLAEAVRLHLLIPNVATRRDIADVAVIREVAGTIRDTRMLNLLYILAVADSRASGPDVWSPWRARLMQTLYLRLRDMLQSEHAEDETAASLRERAEKWLAARFDQKEVALHLNGLPVSYLLSTPPETIGQHITLIQQANGGTAVKNDKAGEIDRLTIVTPDRPGILALVAGTLAVHNVNVLGGTAFTRDDGVAIQVMHVGDALRHGIDERRWTRVIAAVPEALAGNFPVDEKLAQTRETYRSNARAPIEMETSVHVENGASQSYSVVEVNTNDRLGLLYAITKALHELSLDIHLAKVDTIGQEVADAFYVKGSDNSRVEDPAAIEAIRNRVTEAVHALDS